MSPNTLQEAIVFFAEPKLAHQFLAAIRWSDGKPKCTHCGSEKVGIFSGKRMVSNCKNCKKQFTVKLGTIFEDSPIPLSKWLPAVWLIVNSKNGISSYELGRSLGVTQKTAWFMLHRIRLAMQNGTIVKVGGEVEVDETYIGGKARNMHADKRKKRVHGKTGGFHMTPVQGLLQRHGNGSKIIVKVPRTKLRSELLNNVKEYVLKGSNVYTDATSSYTKLGFDGDYIHKVVDHAECYVKGKVHTNGLENFWSLLKRSVRGTYVSVQPFHLFRYLDEQAFRFNERKDNDSERFMKAMGGIIRKGMKYVDLIGKGEEKIGAV